MRAYYYHSEDPRGQGALALTTAIANRFAVRMGDTAPTPRVMTMTEDNAFYVVKHIDVPSVLCEVGFVTNKTDAKNLLDENWRQAAAEAIAEGILDYIRHAGA